MADSVKNRVDDGPSPIANWLIPIATVLTQATPAQPPPVLEAYPGDPFKLDRDRDSIAQRFAALDVICQQLRLMMKAFFGDYTDLNMEIDRLT